MKKYLKYDTINNKISQTMWDKNLTAKTESMMALGNGYLGLRSVDEEMESFNKEDLFVNGVFNKENENEVSELANLADSIQNQIILDGEQLSLNQSDTYLKTLNIENGSLLRIIKIKRNNKSFEITFERFVSQDNNHLYGQKINIKQLSGKNTQLIVNPMINGQTTNAGAQHFAEGTKKRIAPNTIRYIEKSTLSNRVVIHNLLVNAKIGSKAIKTGTDDHIITMSRRRVGFKISATLSKENDFKLEKLMTVNTSIDDNTSLKSEKKVMTKSNELFELLKSTSYNKELKKSNDAWKNIWKQFYIEIKGKSEDAKYDSMANKFAIFHMNSFVPKNNSNLSVGAKGLSGEGYQGHSYWDTEFFIVPNYLYTNPKIARNLLEYRYKGIEGARAKAMEVKERKEESKLKGAQFPWEMAWPTDGEVCPYWGQADVITGEQVPIASRRQEIHVPADIAYAVNQYYNFTNDDKFMNDMGYEIIFDTAMFWSQRAEKQTNGKYEIKDVMGPNEYKGNIDNNAYINMFAKQNLELALHYKNKLSKTPAGKKIMEKALSKIPYKINFSAIKNISEKLIQQLPNKEGIIAENDQFLKLQRNNVAPFQLLGDAGKKLFNTKAGHKLLASQLVKQADVVLLTYLLPHLYDEKVIKSNFNYYEPITTHDSSLSPTTYAIQAVDLRKMNLAYKLYKYSLNIDMGENMFSCNAGIHAGSIAAVWQSTVFGYGGLRWVNGEISFTPILPSQWEGLNYKITYKGVEIIVKISKTSATFNTLNNKKIKVKIYGEYYEISSKQIKVGIK